MNFTLIIPSYHNFLYLGLPIGDENFIADYFNEKMNRVERSMYSLRGVGCKLGWLNPIAMAFMYRQFCHSILKYGLENLSLSNPRLKAFNIRQNILQKNILVINRCSRTKPLFQVIKIESIELLYLKHKMFFLKQIIKNDLEKYLWLS